MSWALWEEVPLDADEDAQKDHHGPWKGQSMEYWSRRGAVPPAVAVMQYYQQPSKSGGLTTQQVAELRCEGTKLVWSGACATT